MTVYFFLCNYLPVSSPVIFALKQTDLVFPLLSVSPKCAMEQCVRACAQQCNHRRLISVCAQASAAWLAPPQRRAFDRVCIYEDCPLQMLFCPLSFWYILCWLFELTCCHLKESDDTLWCVITLCEQKLSWAMTSPHPTVKGRSCLNFSGCVKRLFSLVELPQLLIE